ncbi:hypothetical protein G7B40_038270 [Aetokthonos hydrillicola Thurmond2011]|jgi:hypothetical protein|uniref:Uncharacterized protein n=1 Tax=Aetokthonos hydrillicola Thurmond2011 TaxID=2712845 RepID=A0AAP5IES7_9CYAN|nr:hypothetical protein [Aetokthonos hydrillicola]MBO3464201.1 hypothetical protein [Aetokthonos hydrillicola CCALA 1050]MBW4590639.1 hypothetical protein [Aetokthonos hydrillicola CCALA 1050]MDR9900353.1 hypothetical protein [Aetokthonos hydrillicola Thurmond2011]
MEPLTAGVILTLALTKMFEKTAEKFTESALAKMDELRNKIWEKFRGNVKVETALRAAEKGSKKDLDTVAAYLQVLMHEDPAFAEEIRAIAKEIKAGEKHDNGNFTQINQDNATGYQNHITGGEVFQGTNTINKYSNPN